MDGIGRMPYQMPGAGGVMRSGMTPGAAMVGGIQIPGMPRAPMANMCGWEIMGGASWALYGGFFNGPEGIFQRAGFGAGMDNLMMAMDMQNRSIDMCLQYMVQQSVMQTNMNCAMMMQMAMMMDRINTLEAMLRNSSAATEKYMELMEKMMKKQEEKSQPQPEPPAPQPPAPQPPAPQPPAPQPPAPQPTPPVVQPQVKKEPTRQEKAAAFVDTLKREGSSVSPQTIKALGRQHGLGENEVDWLITWLSEVDSGSVDFTNGKVIEMCNIFVAAAGADGNMSKFAKSVEMYCNSSVAKSDNLSKECYEALAYIAGSPEGWQTLRDQLGNISGWRWGGANMTRDDVKNQIRAWITG